MPKSRPTDRKQVNFQVSPWIQVKEHTKPPAEGSVHAEVILPIAQPSSRVAPGAQPPSTSAASSSLAVPSATEVPWRTTKQQRTVEPEVPPTYGAEEEAAAVAAAEADDISAQHVLEGPAVLAVLPSGAISGHLIDSQHQRAYGISGRVLYRTFDCTTEDDWLLLHVTLMDFSSPEEAHAIVEKTGGDMMRLTPPSGLPVAVHKAVEAQVPDLDQMGDVEFACEQLHVDDKAQRVLARYQPKLLGRADVMVNQGWMKWRTCQ